MIYLRKSRDFIYKIASFRSGLRSTILISSLALTPFVSTHSYAVEIAVVVNSTNPISTITPEELRAIFMAQRFTFGDGGEAIVVNLGRNNPVKNDFYKKATGLSAKQIKRKWAAAAFSGQTEFPEEFKTAPALISWIKENKNTIGYVAIGDVTSDVKVIMRLP